MSGITTQELQESINTVTENEVYEIFEKHFKSPIVPNRIKLDAIREIASVIEQDRKVKNYYSILLADYYSKQYADLIWDQERASIKSWFILAIVGSIFCAILIYQILGG